MIVDKLENWQSYHFGAAWKLAFEFLMTLSSDSEEKKYNILGEDIFAMVMSYDTKSSEAAVLEAHRKYVDIQTVLAGGEGIEWFPRDGLVVETKHDEVKDVEFYKRTCSGAARVDVSPGTFVMLSPQDGHMPGLKIGANPELVKKVVVKINVDLLTPTVG